MGKTAELIDRKTPPLAIANGGVKCRNPRLLVGQILLRARLCKLIAPGTEFQARTIHEFSERIVRFGSEKELSKALEKWIRFTTALRKGASNHRRHGSFNLDIAFFEGRVKFAQNDVRVATDNQFFHSGDCELGASNL